MEPRPLWTMLERPDHREVAGYAGLFPWEKNEAAVEAARDAVQEMSDDGWGGSD